MLSRTCAAQTVWFLFAYQQAFARDEQELHGLLLLLHGSTVLVVVAAVDWVDAVGYTMNNRILVHVLYQNLLRLLFLVLASLE